MPASAEKVSELKPPNNKHHDADNIDKGGGEDVEEDEEEEEDQDGDSRSVHGAAEEHGEEREEAQEDASRTAAINAFLRAGSTSGGGATGTASAGNGGRYGTHNRRRAQAALMLSVERGVRTGSMGSSSSSAPQRPSSERDRREPTKAQVEDTNRRGSTDGGPPSLQVQRSRQSMGSGQQEDGEGSGGKGGDKEVKESVAVDIEGLAEDLMAREGEAVRRIEALRSQVGLGVICLSPIEPAWNMEVPGRGQRPDKVCCEDSRENSKKKKATLWSTAWKFTGRCSSARGRVAGDGISRQRSCLGGGLRGREQSCDRHPQVSGCSMQR